MEAKIFDGPIWIQAKLVSKYFEENIQMSYTIRDADKIEHRIVHNWPLAAFEELAANGSPDLKFLPDNEADDYTMAVICINPEFAEISEEEKTAGAAQQKADKKKKPIKADKKPIKADKKPIKAERKEKVLSYIDQNGAISNMQAKELLGLAESTVKRLLKEMVNEGLLQTEGEKKSRRYKKA